MRHGRDCPSRCSQCIGASAQIVTLRDGQLLVDGKSQDRSPDLLTPMQTHAYLKRKKKP